VRASCPTFVDFARSASWPLFCVCSIGILPIERFVKKLVVKALLLQSHCWCTQFSYPWLMPTGAESGAFPSVPYFVTGGWNERAV
jgi:hypothetical protein